jgi:hypothetical protein
MATGKSEYKVNQKKKKKKKKKNKSYEEEKKDIESFLQGILRRFSFSNLF